MEAKFCDRLKAIREKQGLTQQQLADASGMHRVQITRLEAGQHVPSWDTVQALAAALGVDCTAFQESPPAEKKKKKG
jgi:transcriptional regulator with XRE-family HTH domain